MCLASLCASAAEPASPAIQKIAAGLKSPRSVAVRPDGVADQYEVFVAEAGAGKVVKFSPAKPEKTIDVVSGFAIPSSSDADRPPVGLGSLMFLDHLRLLIAGTDDDRQPFFQLYEVSESDAPVTADQHKSDAHLPDGKKNNGEGLRILPGIAHAQPNEKFGNVVIVPSRADTGPDGVVFVPVRAGMLAEPVPMQLTNPNSDLAIDSIAAAKTGYIVLAGRENKSDRTSLIAFVNPLDRKVVMQVPVELERIVALAYNPKTGDLYTANADPQNKNSGIFRMDATEKNGAVACTPTKIVDVANPSALAFTPSGTLYVTAANDGTLMRIENIR